MKSSFMAGKIFSEADILRNNLLSDVTKCKLSFNGLFTKAADHYFDMMK